MLDRFAELNHISPSQPRVMTSEQNWCAAVLFHQCLAVPYLLWEDEAVEEPERLSKKLKA